MNMTVIKNTPTSSTADTPSTSAAPSTIADAPVKTQLRLAVRKNIRDNFEVKCNDLETYISTLLGVPWKVAIDAEYIYPLATDSYAQDNTGSMFTEYIERAIIRIDEFIQRYGDYGKVELNNLASKHVITLAPTERDIGYTGCDISDGLLRLLFTKGNLGVNIDQACEDLAGAISDAGVATNGGDESVLTFHAKSSIRADYDPRIDELTARCQKIFALPVLELTPNFETNFAKLATYRPENYDFPSNWQQSFGRYCFEYFEGFASAIEELGFAKDDMLQEGFKEAVEKNEVSLRVVDKLVSGSSSYNECIVENGILYIQITPRDWSVNIGDPARSLIDVL